MYYGFVYITENLVNGKKYIGQRSYLKPGWEKYLGSGRLLLKAIRRYGRENFSRTIVFEAACRETLNAAEREWIARTDAVANPNFYNLVPGGHGCSMGFRGKRHSEATRTRMREAALGHPVADHVREAVRQARTGRRFNSQSKQKHLLATPRGARHHASKAVIIDGVEYSSISEAELRTGISKYLIRKLIASK